MKNIYYSSIVATSTLAALLAFGALAMQPDKIDKKEKHVYKLPDDAVEVAPNVYSLGVKPDVDGTLLEGYAFVHPKKSDGHSHGGGSRTDGTTCYSFLALGAKWKTAEPYLVNAANGDGLTPNFVASTLSSGINEWEKNVSTDILGTGTLTNETLTAESSAPDGRNEVLFGAVSDPGVIAVTTVWGIFEGPPKGRELREWDMVFNDPNFMWGDVLATGNTSLMDLQNIGTHELGHAMGMGHPSDSCTEETMYRFATNGETKKRDLNTGDIRGIQQLYR